MQLPAARGPAIHQLDLGRNVADDLSPCAVGRGVQVDPRDEPVPRLGVQSYAVVIVTQNLYEFARVGVKIPRRQEVTRVLIG